MRNSAGCGCTTGGTMADERSLAGTIPGHRTTVDCTNLARNALKAPADRIGDSIDHNRDTAKHAALCAYHPMPWPWWFAGRVPPPSLCGHCLHESIEPIVVQQAQRPPGFTPLDNARRGVRTTDAHRRGCRAGYPQSIAPRSKLLRQVRPCLPDLTDPGRSTAPPCKRMATMSRQSVLPAPRSHEVNRVVGATAPSFPIRQVD